MANTVIALKKSAIPSATPTSLANGEIAINYADGIIYYKAANGTIASISSGTSSFGTVNAGGTLVVADAVNDVFDIRAGQNIIITGDAINDRMTIDADLTAANSWANTKLSNGTVTLAGALTTTGQITASSQINITPTGGDEGGEIQLQGPGDYTDWSIDSYQNNFRVFTVTGSTTSNVNFFHAGAGSIKMGVNKADPAYAIDVSGDVNVSGAFRVNGIEINTGGTVDLSPANNWANTLSITDRAIANGAANSANVYTLTVGAASNNYANASFYTIANGVASFTKSNSAYDLANAAYNYANTIIDTANNNVIFNHANAAFDKANSANALAYNTGIGANSYTITVGAASNNYADSVGLAGNNYTNAVGVAGNNYIVSVGAASNTWANAVGASANSYADSVGLAGNNYTDAVGLAGNNYTDAVGVAGNNYTNVVGVAGNNYTNYVGQSANNYANNTYLKLSGGTITGDLSITGNVFLLGNATSISTNNLIVNDSLIYLAANNDLSDIVDIGFVGHYSNGTANLHTGLFRDHASKEYFLFSEMDGPEPELTNDLVPYANGMINAALHADLITSNLNLGGANAIVWITNAYDKANAANVLAYNTGIGANAYSSAVGVSANLYTNAVGVAGNNYTVSVGAASNTYANASFYTIANGAAAFARANDAYENANAAFNKANSSGVIVSNTTPSSPTANTLWWNSEYGRLLIYYNDGDTSQWVDTNPATDYRVIWNTANLAFGVTNSAFGVANAAFGVANAAFGVANAAFLQTNTVYSISNTIYNATNSAFSTANSAFIAANNAASTGKAIAMAIVFGG